MGRDLGVVVAFESYKYRKYTLIFNISKNNLSDEVLANLRPLYTSNMAKVSIVKWKIAVFNVMLRS